MIKCAKCDSTLKSFALCNPCYNAWPKGNSLEEYLGRAHNIEIQKLPLSPTIRIDGGNILPFLAAYEDDE